MELHLVSKETKVVSDLENFESEYVPEDLSILNEEKSFKMDEVSAIIFVENLNDVNKNSYIGHYNVGLMYIHKKRLHISIRNIRELNKPLFTIALSTVECNGLCYRTISISWVQNADGFEVVAIKGSNNDDTDRDFVKVFIRTNSIDYRIPHTWSQF